MSAKTYLTILQGGVFLSLFMVFFVFSSLLFPFITSKQLPFNILMELLLPVWAVFIWKYPSYRPQKSWITWGLLAYMLAMALSLIVSVDPALSFWGDAERMLGIFHITHFFIFYLIVISVFRQAKDWDYLFLTSVVTATAVSLIGLFRLTYSTIGNTAYVSGYLIFNLYFAALLFYRYRHQLWRWVLLLPVTIMLLEFAKAKTSGAIIGLGASILFLIFLFALWTRRKQAKIYSWLVLVLSAVILLVIFSQQNAAWFQNSFLRNLTAQKNTFQTRLVSWEAAAKDFPQHPILGVGFGNFADVFDRHFDARFYTYSRGETYFDRAHNNLIDIAATTGAVGLLTYLAIFVALAYYLLRLIKQDQRDFEPFLIIALVTAYFIQNLAIFDSFVTYLGLMLILAYVYYLNNKLVADKPVKKVPEGWLLVIGFIIMAILALNTNIKAWQQFRLVIQGYGEASRGDFLGGLATYQKAFAIKTPLDRDGKVSFMNLVLGNSARISALPEENKQQIIEYAISLAEENAAHNRRDSLSQLQLAQVYNLALSADLGDKYLDLTQKALDASLAASPERLPVYFLKANLLASEDKIDEAITLLEPLPALNPDFPDAYCYLFRFHNLADHKEQASSYADQCLAKGGASALGMGRDFMALLDYYYQKQDWPHALVMAQQLVAYQPNQVETNLFLAEVYYRLGDQENSAIYLEQANILQGAKEALLNASSTAE